MNAQDKNFHNLIKLLNVFNLQQFMIFYELIELLL